MPLTFPADLRQPPAVSHRVVVRHGLAEHRRTASRWAFKSRSFARKPDIDANNPSAFTPHQLLIAHCALSDPKRGRLWQDQRIRRAGLGLAEAAVGDTDVWIDRWSLKRDAAGYPAKIDAEDFSFDSRRSPKRKPCCSTAMPASAARAGGGGRELLLQPAAPAGGGHHRAPGQRRPRHRRSLVRSRMVQRVPRRRGGGLGLDRHQFGRRRGADGVSHPRRARRDSAGPAARCAPATGKVQILRPDGCRVSRAGGSGLSPRTRIAYPVEWHVRAGTREFDLEPLLDDQENDTRLSTGAIYWEGAVRAYRGAPSRRPRLFGTDGIRGTAAPAMKLT